MKYLETEREVEEVKKAYEEQQSKLEQKLKEKSEKKLSLARTAEQVEAIADQDAGAGRGECSSTGETGCCHQKDMNLFVLEDVPVIVTAGRELDGIDGRKR